MATKGPDRQLNLFVPLVSDASLRDQRETMERPFFSLSKNKRLKPIEYENSRDGVFVTVRPHPEYGMATIWDADILIWAASVICEMQNRKVNDLPRTLHFQPYDLLKAIRRGTSGAQYQRLREALWRLRSTDIRTNIRAPRGKKEANFGWISEWTDLVDENGASKGMSLTLSEWFFEGIIREGGILSIDPRYFDITGGRERWLYRVARKHAGGNGAEGFAISLPVLFEKSGAEGTYRRFKFEILKVAKENALPGYHLTIEAATTGDEPLLRMIRRDMLGDIGAPALPKRPKVKPPPEGQTALPFRSAILPEAMIQKVRSDFPGWDVYALQAQFDAWLEDGEDRQPDNYASAFYGFVKQYHARNHHQLR
jgi:plasmid replication initiation protein